jgi:predicted ester cyclase
MTESDNIKTLLGVIEDVNAGDLASTVQAVTPDFARHDLTGFFSATQGGGAEVTNFLSALMAALTGFRIDVEDVFSAGERVVARYRFSGRHTGELLGVAPTQRPIEFSGINIYRFEAEKFAEVWQLWDWAGVFQQLGVLNTESLRSGG